MAMIQVGQDAVVETITNVRPKEVAVRCRRNVTEMCEGHIFIMRLELYLEGDIYNDGH